MARISKELQELKKIIDEDLKIDDKNIENLEIDTNIILNLKENASYMTDKRLQEYIYYSLESILLIVIFGIMANCNTFVEIYLFMKKDAVWLDKHINFDFGLPSLSTIKRVIGMIIPTELEEVLNDCLKTFIYTNKNYYEDEEITIKDLKSMDGKTANSSDRKNLRMVKFQKQTL